MVKAKQPEPEILQATGLYVCIHHLFDDHIRRLDSAYDTLRYTLYEMIKDNEGAKEKAEKHKSEFNSFDWFYEIFKHVLSNPEVNKVVSDVIGFVGLDYNFAVKYLVKGFEEGFRVAGVKDMMSQAIEEALTFDPDQYQIVDINNSR